MAGSTEISDFNESGIASPTSCPAGNDRNIPLITFCQEKALGVDRIDGIDHAVQGTIENRIHVFFRQKAFLGVQGALGINGRDPFRHYMDLGLGHRV